MTHDDSPQKGFRSLFVYQKALATIRRTASLCKTAKWGDYRYLKDQLLRATSSVAANIAEGHSRESLGDSARFLMIAKASAAECSHHLEEAAQVGIISRGEADEVIDQHEQVERMLRGLIAARNRQLGQNRADTGTN
jgi:four helix bundle protein